MIYKRFKDILFSVIVIYCWVAQTCSSLRCLWYAGPRNNVWSSTFDPGRNQNMKKMGSSYYDKPIDNKTVWDQTLDSQKGQASTPQSPTVASNNSMGMDVSEVQKLAAKNSKNGVVDMDAFMKSLKTMQ